MADNRIWTFEEFLSWNTYIAKNASLERQKQLYAAYCARPKSLDELVIFDDDENLGDWEDGLPEVPNNPEG